MMFQLGSLFGIILGYFLCIGHAKLTLYLYNHSPEGRREETDRLNAEWLARQPPQPPITDTAVLPSSFYGDGRPLSEVWNLPTKHQAPATKPLDLHHPDLIKSKRCPTGFSAAQVLGYHQIGQPDVPPLFNGGLDEWPY
jgi:hypothetical protein